MQKLVIQTQYLENYGSSENPYMKFKGGSTYVMHNCGDIEPKSNELVTAVARVKPFITTDLVQSNGGCEEYIIDVDIVPHNKKVCADWETVTEFYFDSKGNAQFMKVTDNREDGWMKSEILEKIETWTNDNEDYKAEYQMEDGDFCVGDAELQEWFNNKGDSIAC